MSDQFEFTGPGGLVVRTGCLLPETYPLSFKPFPDDMLRPLDEIAAIIKNKDRLPSRQKWGTNRLINQQRLSSCNAAMGAAILSRAVFNSTGQWFDLCWEYLYSMINGGRDDGSQLADGMEWLTDYGCPLLMHNGTRLIPSGTFKKNLISMETQRFANEQAKAYRCGECYQMPNNSVEKCFHSLLSGIAGRGVGGIAVHVGNDYMNRSGVVAGFDRGPGNHAICVDDVICLTDKPKSIEDFRLSSPQSWGTNFADGGWTQITHKHIAEPMKYHGLYVCRSALLSAEDVSNTRL